MDPDKYLEERKKEDPAWVVFFGVLAAVIMLVVILGLLNKFVEWAFGVGVNL